MSLTKYILTFENFTELNQERGSQISNTEPSFNYSEIQDILGNRYDYKATRESLKDFKDKVIKDTNNTDSEFFIKTWLEHQRNTNRLTPPLSDSEELVNNSDFYKRGYNDSKNESLLNEDGVASATSSVSGMGAVVSPQVSSVPGQTGTTGSGDVGVGLKNNFIKRPTGSRRKQKAEAIVKSMTKNYQNQLSSSEDTKVCKPLTNIMSFDEFTKSKSNNK